MKTEEINMLMYKFNSCKKIRNATKISIDHYEGKDEFTFRLEGAEEIGTHEIARAVAVILREHSAELLDNIKTYYAKRQLEYGKQLSPILNSIIKEIANDLAEEQRLEDNKK